MLILKISANDLFVGGVKAVIHRLYKGSVKQASVTPFDKENGGQRCVRPRTCAFENENEKENRTREKGNEKKIERNEKEKERTHRKTAKQTNG